MWVESTAISTCLLVCNMRRRGIFSWKTRWHKHASSISFSQRTRVTGRHASRPDLIACGTKGALADSTKKDRMVSILTYVLSYNIISSLVTVVKTAMVVTTTVTTGILLDTISRKEWAGALASAFQRQLSHPQQHLSNHSKTNLGVDLLRCVF